MWIDDPPPVRGVARLDRWIWRGACWLDGLGVIKLDRAHVVGIGAQWIDNGRSDCLDHSDRAGFAGPRAGPGILGREIH